MSENDTALQPQSPGEPDFPDDLPVLPVRDTVLFPHAVMPLNIGRESSIALVQSLGENKYFGVVAQKDPRVDEPSADEMYPIGTLAVIHKSVRMPNNSLLIFCEGLARIEVQEYLVEKPFFRIKYGRIEEPKGEPAQEVEALRRNAVSIFEEIVQLSPSLSDDIPAMVNNIEDPGRTADFMAATLPGLSADEVLAFP
jgi:ATP-dependent Lon protease